MLVQGDQGSQSLRGEALGQDRGGRPVAFAHPVGDLPFGDTGCGQLNLAAPECQALGLGEHVSHELVVMVPQSLDRVPEPDELHWHQPGSLVQQLVEGVLAVGARSAPDDWTCIGADPPTAQVDVLSVGLHLQLLEVRGQAGQVAAVGEHRDALRAQEVVVPH